MQRNTVIRFQEKIVVQRQIQECFDYLVDLVNLQEWNPSIIAVKQISKGPPSVNWEYEVTIQLGLYQLPIRTRLQKIEDKKTIVFRGEHELFAFEDTLTFTYEGDMTGINYQTEVELKGYWSYLTPVLKPLITQVGKRSVERLEKALGEQPGYQPATRLERIADRLIIPGLAKFTRFGYELEHRDWTPHAGFLKNKNAIVAGNLDGIGRAVVSNFARLGARVLVIGPDETQGILLQKQIQEETGKEIIFEQADLSEVGQTISVASRVYQHFEKLDILVNNCGNVYQKRETSTEGVEKTFASCLLCPFILIETLHDLLKKSEGARVINVSTGMIYTQKPDLKDVEYKDKPYQGNLAYARAKRGMIDIVEVWAEKWKDDNIVLQSMHPGWADTQTFKESMPTVYKLMKPILRTPEQGADTIIWLATAPSPAENSGLFWLDRRPHPTALIASTQTSSKEQKKLYETLLSYWEKMTEKKTGT